MKLYRDGLAAMAIVLAPVTAASAQEAKPACPATPAKLPAELAGWSTRTPLAAAGEAGKGAVAQLAIGKAVDLRLLPTAQVTYPVAPERPAPTASSGGIAGFSVDRAGTYRVALGAGPWIDVVQDGKALPSAGHGHGPDCSGVRKMVDFKLAPGRYLLQVSGSAAPAVAAMVTRLP